MELLGCVDAFGQIWKVLSHFFPCFFLPLSFSSHPSPVMTVSRTSALYIYQILSSFVVVLSCRCSFFFLCVSDCITSVDISPCPDSFLCQTQCMWGPSGELFVLAIVFFNTKTSHLVLFK